MEKAIAIAIGKEPIGTVAQAVIDGWKKANPDGVFALVHRERIGYFKNPTRDDIDAVLSSVDADRPMGMYEDMAKTLWLGGDPELMEAPERFLGIAQHMKKKLEGDAFRLVNL